MLPCFGVLRSVCVCLFAHTLACLWYVVSVGAGGMRWEVEFIFHFFSSISLICVKVSVVVFHADCCDFLFVFCSHFFFPLFFLPYQRTPASHPHSTHSRLSACSPLLSPALTPTSQVAAHCRLRHVSDHFHLTEQTFSSQESAMLFIFLKKCDFYCLNNTNFSFLYFLSSDIGRLSHSHARPLAAAE